MALSCHVSTAYIGMGANLGDREATLDDARAQLDATPGIEVRRHSSLYVTAAVGYSDQPDFLNAVAELETDLGPRQLLDCLHRIEQGLGRVRSFRDAPRTCDLDLLLFDRCVLEAPGITVPHPRMAERRFVLEPLAELDPLIVLPDGRAVADLLAAVGEQKVVRYGASCRTSKNSKSTTPRPSSG